MTTSNNIFSCFDKIHYWHSRLCPPIGLIANIGLIYLIIKKTPKEMRIHSRILLQTCVIDIALLIVTVFGQPVKFFKEILEFWGNGGALQFIISQIKFVIMESNRNSFRIR